LIFWLDLEDAKEGFSSRKLGTLSWWGLFAFVLAIPFLLYGLFRWASADPGIERDIAKDRFRAEQEGRALRRSGTRD
jgi:hypothetical protein